MLLLVSPALVGLAVALLAWVVLHGLVRLRPALGALRESTPILFRLFLPFARMLAPRLRGSSLEPVLAKTDLRLVQAGLDQQYTPEEFVALRIVYAVFFLALGPVFMITGLRVLVFFGVILLIFGAVFPGYWLGQQVARRHRSIQRSLPHVLDLMTLSVEAGRDFLTALHEILLQRNKDPLGEELERVFREVQLGKPRRQSLRNMATRVQQPDLTLVAETLAQADELGVSIGHILRILGDQMRQKRFQTAERLANESPVKLLIPLFLFIFPAVIIVMLGPILLRSLRFLAQ